MTAKNYILLSQVLQNAYHIMTVREGDDTYKVYKNIVHEFCRFLWVENTRFDHKKFYRACNILEQDIPEAINVY